MVPTDVPHDGFIAGMVDGEGQLLGILSMLNALCDFTTCVHHSCSISVDKMQQ